MLDFSLDSVDQWQRDHMVYSKSACNSILRIQVQSSWTQLLLVLKTEFGGEGKSTHECKCTGMSKKKIVGEFKNY